MNTEQAPKLGGGGGGEGGIKRNRQARRAERGMGVRKEEREPVDIL